MGNVVSLISIRDGKILAIKRKKDPYKGLYGLPGGHVELGETLIDALHREIKEETNQFLGDVQYIASIYDQTNNIYLYFADIIGENIYEVDDEGVEHIAWIPISTFIDGFHQYNVIGREELIPHIQKFIINI